MEAPMQSLSAPRSDRAPRRRNSRRAFLIFVFIWVMLIAAGLTGAKLYSDHMQASVTADVSSQTKAQLALMQHDYDERLKKLEESYKGEIAVLQSKIDALNELLTFTKDNANAKTDNSNKLYTQLNDVKKQLEELKKNLDVLK
ncbi:conserved hypothetical protein [Paenibacillus curdlanolyticus YK9]|uniref:Uncharacterized protein n=1 Tax=Paenibacillus curdlanolyticus YK9 TaxID=717606 RepID=E0IA03_9BACL|nr:hypothetical protein [Paenibacillus curdlanolyticus]EFM10580.1 conserved hypothetical protein [Paenibacillus curdlanolyticus YK9]